MSRSPVELVSHDQARVAAPAADRVDATVIICTYNRAALLAETLDSLAATRNALTWDVVVVDNNSTDETASVVAARGASYPVPLRYVFEPRQGKTPALNTGIAATDATVVVFTDDDLRVHERWLEEACRPILDDSTIDYTGGPVLPIWDSPCPPWVDRTRSELWGTLALLDYGPEPFVFEERRRVPLGANMAVRRALFNRLGGFDTTLGRVRDSLRGQEQAEFFCRSRAAGARGLYVPSMTVEHHVPGSRLTRDYFRRWWFWKGVARHQMERAHPTTELGLDLRHVVRVAGVPRYMFGSAVRNVGRWIAALFTGNVFARVRHEMMIWYFAGYVRGSFDRWRAL